MKPKTKIEALNYLNAQAPQILAELNQILSPYIGKKIQKAHPWDKWVAKVSPQIQALTDKCRDGGIRIIFRFYNSHLCATIDTTVPSGNYSVDYVAQDFAVADISGHDLKALRDPASLNLRTDYTEAEIADKQAQVAKLKEEIFRIEGEIPAQLRNY